MSNRKQFPELGLKRNLDLEDMLLVNVRQARFYDSIAEAEESSSGKGYGRNRDANIATRFWAWLRYRQQDALVKSGVMKKIVEMHRNWILSKKGGDFLEIGCFQGSPFTFELIAGCSSYLGIDLSARAIQTLLQIIRNSGLVHNVRVVQGDFLTFEFDRKYDVVYANGVLHHFANPKILFEIISRVLKRDGILIFTEPVSVNRGFALLRCLYRPFQSDREWEWPFNANTVQELERRFVVSDGFGWGRWSLPLSVICAFTPIRRIGLGLYCRVVNSESREHVGRTLWLNSTVTCLCVKR